ncbi:MAG: NAD(P)H-binding protein [Pseudomonadota bacterium]
MKVTLLGATGTVGRATLSALRLGGHEVRTPGRADYADLGPAMTGMEAVISCIASRSGVPRDAWAVDHGLNAAALRAAQAAGVTRFVMLSAICVQKPRLAFQYAKLAFEAELAGSGLTYSIVRPTAYFKSLSGQVERVRAGKPFLTFGNGTLTACKPISDADLARYLVECLSVPGRENAVLPIGGPGPALTPLDQARLMGDALGVEVRTRSVTPRLLSGIAAALELPRKLPGVWAPKLMEKAALARIGHYYATESMLVWNGTAYDADATPEYGTDTLADHYRALAAREVVDDRGAHAVF